MLETNESFQSRCIPRDMLSFSKSYFGDTDVKTEPTRDSLRDSGTSWNPKWVVRDAVDGPAEVSSERVKELPGETAGGTSVSERGGWLLAYRANESGAARSCLLSTREVDASDMMIAQEEWMMVNRNDTWTIYKFARDRDFPC